MRRSVVCRVIAFWVFAAIVLCCPNNSALAIGNYNVNFASDGYTGGNPFIGVGNGSECTWFVWGRVYEKLGISMSWGNGVQMGNARDWPSLTDYPTGYEARTNSIMVEIYGTTGHVMFVEKVENGKAYVTHSNCGDASVNHGYAEGYVDLESNKYYCTYNHYIESPHVLSQLIYIYPAEYGEYMNTGNTYREIPDGDYMIASAADPAYYLDISGGDMPASDGANVQLWSLQINDMVGDCDAWTIKYNKYTNDGFYTISQYKQSSQCLDVSAGSTMNGENVQVWSDNQGSAQQWAITKNWVDNGGPGKGYRLEARCSGYSLDIEDGSVIRGTNVRQWRDNMYDAQKWLFIPYKPSQTLPEGRYIMLADDDTSFEVTVADDGSNIRLWSDTAQSRNNSFDIIPLDNGYYKLIHAASGGVLEVSEGSILSAANIQLGSDRGTGAQQWAITPQRDGFLLRPRCSGYAMDLEDGKLQNGQNIRQLFCNGAKAQTWVFVPAEYAVTYHSNGGGSTPEAQIKYYKETLLLTGDIPSRAGYTFLGWASDSGADTPEFRPGNFYDTDADLSLYAVWIAPDFVLPEDLRIIQDEAFRGDSFRYAYLPDGVESIGSCVFDDCRNLQYVRIPETATSIDQNAFGDLKDITLIGTAGSFAETYADQKGYVFLAEK